jgi:hypothetical protein
MTPSASSPSWRAALESAVLAGAAPAIGCLLDRRDAFFLAHRFSWLAFIPLLVGLRHGFVLGCASALLLDACLVFSWRAHALGVAAFPGETLVALIALAMLAGQFSDVWRRESKRALAGLDSVRKRLDETSRAHALLELSHDRLDEQTRGAPNLREALAAVRALASGVHGGRWEPLAPAILEIFATYAMVEVASLHRVPSGGAAEPEAVAVLGRPRAMAPHDPLVREALGTGRLTYLPAVAKGPRGPASNLLVAVPFIDAAGRARAVLCVESLPFMAFHQGNLQLIATLAGHLSDLFWGAARDALGGRRQQFEQRVAQALEERRASDVPVALAGLRVRRGSPMSDIVAVVLGGALREGDVPLVTRELGGDHVVYLLLPGTDEGAARALEERIANVVRQELHLPLDRAGALFAFHLPGGRDTAAGAVRLVAEKVQVDEKSPHLPLLG